MLIEGAPGIGRTVLLKQMACYWTYGTILREARIVLHLYLRDPRFKSVTSARYIGCLEENQEAAVTKELKKLMAKE